MPAELPLLFSAVLLAGGRSSRMPCDTAGRMIRGRPLWEHQLATLRGIGPAELFISGRADGPYAQCGCPIVADETPDRGPLGGVATALRRTAHERVVVLAIDLPRMSSQFFTTLLREVVHVERAVVPRNEELFEPLAAVYTRACLPMAEEQLRSADRSMQRFVRAIVRADLAVEYPISAVEKACFLNLNTETDWQAICREGNGD